MLRWEKIKKGSLKKKKKRDYQEEKKVGIFFNICIFIFSSSIKL
jgi:hypothetical protein